MGMFDVLDLVREGGWKTGVKMKEKKREQMGGGMRLQNQILQSFVGKKTEKTSTMNARMNIMNIDVDIMKNHDDIIKTNNNNINNFHVINNKEIIKIEEALLPNDDNKPKIIEEKIPQVAPKKVPKIEEPISISSKTILEVVQTKQGTWDRDLYILNPDPDITETIQKTFETHGCSVTVGGLERDLAYLYVLLDRKVSIKKLRKLMEKGKKFGLEFFLTKTGLTSALLARNLGKRYTL